jgi:hypothetical protein
MFLMNRFGLRVGSGVCEVAPTRPVTSEASNVSPKHGFVDTRPPAGAHNAKRRGLKNLGSSRR